MDGQGNRQADRQRERKMRQSETDSRQTETEKGTEKERAICARQEESTRGGRGGWH